MGRVKKTNDALPESWRIDYDGLALFPLTRSGSLLFLSIFRLLQLIPLTAPMLLECY